MTNQVMNLAIGAKDCNEKDICIGDIVKMHYFVTRFDPDSLGRFEDDEEVEGRVCRDCWGTYVEAYGEKYYWMNYLEDIQEEIEVLKSDETYGIACELENKISECEECPAYCSHVCTVDDAGKTPEVCRAFICEWLRKEEAENDERGQNPADVG
jgi:hypothetical protein